MTKSGKYAALAAALALAASLREPAAPLPWGEGRRVAVRLRTTASLSFSVTPTWFWPMVVSTRRFGLVRSASST